MYEQDKMETSGSQEKNKIKGRRRQQEHKRKSKDTLQEDKKITNNNKWWTGEILGEKRG